MSTDRDTPRLEDLDDISGWRAHITSEHGPVTLAEAHHILSLPVPAWRLDTKGNLLEANLLALWVWGATESEGTLEAEQFINANAFRIFADSVTRIPFEENPSFWKAKLRIGDFIVPDTRSPIDELREAYPELQKLYDEMRKNPPEIVWQYLLKIRVDEGGSGRDFVSFRTTVSAVMTGSEEPAGYVAQYDPLNTDSADSIEQMRKQLTGAGQQYIQNLRRVLDLSSSDDGREVRASDEEGDLSDIARVSESRGRSRTAPTGYRWRLRGRSQYAPATRRELVVFVIVAALGLVGSFAATTYVLAIGATSGPIILGGVSITLSTISIILAILGYFHRVEYLGASSAAIEELRAVSALSTYNAVFDEQTQRRLVGRLDDARRLRNGLLVSGDTSMAVALSDAIILTLERRRKAALSQVGGAD